MECCKAVLYFVLYLIILVLAVLILLIPYSSYYTETNRNSHKMNANKSSQANEFTGALQPQMDDELKHEISQIFTKLGQMNVRLARAQQQFDRLEREQPSTSNAIRAIRDKSEQNEKKIEVVSTNMELISKQSVHSHHKNNHQHEEFGTS